jgi:superfamily I DNA/RNA helicase
MLKYQLPNLSGGRKEARAVLLEDILITERVAVSAVHSAKGADGSCVFLIGFDLIDNSYWTDDQIDRLVYIAATRARDQLWIPYTQETALISRMRTCMKKSKA